MVCFRYVIVNILQKCDDDDDDDNNNNGMCRTGDNIKSDSVSNWYGIEEPIQKFKTSRPTTRHLLQHSEGSTKIPEQTALSEDFFFSFQELVLDMSTRTNNNNNNNNKPDIIIRDNEKRTCILIDVAISADTNIIRKEDEKNVKI